jgi:hypothetical protein
MKSFVQWLTESHPMYGMDPHTFDQSDEGWRSLPEKEQSRVISGYIRKNKKKLEPQHLSMLHWHLGQSHAVQGNNKMAIRHMEKSKNDDDQWNRYTDASIAFIKGDKDAFDKHSAGENFNRETLDRLGKNFGKSYKEAY